jgi:hypothetical protein
MADARKDFIMATVANLCGVNTAGADAISRLSADVYKDGNVNTFLDSTG